MQDVIGAALTIAVGLAILATPALNRWFERWSYDSSFRIRPDVAMDEVVFVVMDDASRKALGQAGETQWDRRLHGKLLDQLISRGAKAVLFTTDFSEPAPEPSSDQAFDQALRRARGKAVLSAAVTNDVVRPPIPALAGAAPWGVQLVSMSRDGVCRNLTTSVGVPTAASRVALSLNRSLTNAISPRWLNYYSPALPAVILSYEKALQGGNDLESAKGRLVIVTAGPEESEPFRTPYLRRGSRPFTRADLEATAIFNLARGEGLSRLSPGVEAAVLLVVGGFISLLLMGRHHRRLLLAVLLAAVAVVVVSQLLLVQLQVWFSWMILVGAQIQVAGAWAWFCSTLELPAGKFARRATIGLDGRAEAESPSHGEPELAPQLQPAIPDHTLVRRIGRGAYGEVWLARNVVGRHQAVKIVKASRFSQSTPYEREFKGIERYASVSRSHPGLVQLLHVGRNDANGYFFYIMELADDANAAAPFDPERYVAKTLASELERRRHLPVREVIQIGVALTAALEHLHARQLVHRDIKPSNIIFVDGQVKIADIGLVAPMASGSHGNTRVGTEGYVPPEGPGTASADVYALGKVLYEIAMGRDCWQFPELPTTIGARPDHEALRRLHEIILNAWSGREFCCLISRTISWTRGGLGPRVTILGSPTTSSISAHSCRTGLAIPRCSLAPAMHW